MDITFSELESKFLEERLNLLFQKAYEKGLEDAQRRFGFPEVLTKDHLVQMFQIEKPTVNKLVARPDFPKLKNIQARYPRDQVLAWINENSTWVSNNTNYYSKEAI